MRTRAALIRSAATLFDRDGYDGTSLVRVSRAAGISLGALTFHFSTKGDLADAVIREGHALTRAALRRLTTRPGPPLETVVELTLELARLLEEEIPVRCALRLARERAGSGTAEPGCWSEIWLPDVRELLARAHADGQLRPGIRPSDVITLVEFLTAGAEAQSRGLPRDAKAVDRLADAWRLALAGVSGAPGEAEIPTG
ncbi:TetR family transcriptional regulator (plasmid) [Streptomyces clavuligerus]|nr:TetR/AcrR family transcriptional regulator [Streptomyces clavuligerus]QCS10268.1 TetR family transcriptional regulator [Streptomyces clavuligerus]QPJ98471.1 TetR family transcriptional regulator [Streptomyces clavuligerus]